MKISPLQWTSNWNSIVKFIFHCVDRISLGLWSMMAHFFPFAILYFIYNICFSFSGVYCLLSELFLTKRLFRICVTSFIGTLSPCIKIRRKFLKIQSSNINLNEKEWGHQQGVFRIRFAPQDRSERCYQEVRRYNPLVALVPNKVRELQMPGNRRRSNFDW